MKHFTAFLTMLALCLFSALAQAAYPERPIKLLVGFAAGGSTDLMLRQMLPVLSEELGQPVIVSNMPGSGGGVMAMNLKNSPADGYTLGFNASDAFTLNPLLGAKYKPEDFTFVNGIADAQEAFIATPDKPFNTFNEMLEWAKTKGSPVNVAVQSQSERLLLNILGKKHGVKFNIIPTKGGGEVISSLLGGHSDFAFSGGLHHEYVKAGKFKIIASLPPKPAKAFPDAPTLVSQQGDDATVHQFFLVAGPKGLPDDVREKLAQAFKKAVSNPDVINFAEGKLGFEMGFRDQQQLLKDLEDKTATYVKMKEAAK